MTNSQPQELFELKINVDNPVFGGFGLVKAPSALGRDNQLEDMIPGYDVSEEVRDWQVAELKATWIPPTVIGRVAPFNDFPGISMILPAFSKRACDALKDFLEPNGELLPVKSNVGEYYFYNLRTVVDALDIKESKCVFWCDPPTTATTIDYYAFHKKKLAGTSIFRLVELPISTLVTREFVDRVDKCGLNGFHFAKVWPFPRGVNWRKVDRDKRKEVIKAVGNPKGETLVVMLTLEGKKPSAGETKAIKRLEDQLDAQLFTRTLDTPYFGNYEGSDIVEGEYRMFLSCPDVDAIEKKLEPWILNLEWPNGVFIAKRKGGIYDEDAEEEVFEIY